MPPDEIPFTHVPDVNLRKIRNIYVRLKFAKTLYDSGFTYGSAFLATADATGEYNAYLMACSYGP